MAEYKKVEGFDKVYILTPKKFGDERGYFRENFNRKEFKENTGIDFKPQQINESSSASGVVRGLHFRRGYEAKLVRCIEGSIVDVIVDIRRNSPSYGKVFAVVLNSENQRELFVPRGFAHGFIANGEGANKIEYLVDKNYNKDDDRGYFFDGWLCEYILNKLNSEGIDSIEPFKWYWNNHVQEPLYFNRSEKDKKAKEFHPKKD